MLWWHRVWIIISQEKRYSEGYYMTKSYPSNKAVIIDAPGEIQIPEASFVYNFYLPDEYKNENPMNGGLLYAGISPFDGFDMSFSGVQILK